MLSNETTALWLGRARLYSRISLESPSPQHPTLQLTARSFRRYTRCGLCFSRKYCYCFIILASRQLKRGYVNDTTVEHTQDEVMQVYQSSQIIATQGLWSGQHCICAYRNAGDTARQEAVSAACRPQLCSDSFPLHSSFLLGK